MNIHRIIPGPHFYQFPLILFLSLGIWISNVLSAFNDVSKEINEYESNDIFLSTEVLEKISNKQNQQNQRYPNMMSLTMSENGVPLISSPEHDLPNNAMSHSASSSSSEEKSLDDESKNVHRYRGRRLRQGMSSKPNVSASEVISRISNFTNTCVNAHNLIRKMHGNVGDLVPDEKLVIHSLTWATQIAAEADKGDIENAITRKYTIPQNPFYGYNMGFIMNEELYRFGDKDIIDGGFPVRFWYFTEYPHHFPAKKIKNTYRQNTAHFSQMVWKDTKRIGVAYKVTKDGHIVIVCLYEPTGNIGLQFDDNVFDRDPSQLSKNWDKWLEDENFVRYHKINENDIVFQPAFRKISKPVNA